MIDERHHDRLVDDHGVVGDMTTLAVIDRFGVVDWFCWPRFDSPSVFGSLLDEAGGHWSIRPADDDAGGRQTYLSETNVLLTRFHTSTGVLEIEDLMAIDEERRLVRRVSSLRSDVPVVVEFVPRPDYGRASITIERTDVGVAVTWGDETMSLRTSASHDDIDIVDHDDGPCVRLETIVSEDEPLVFELGARTDVDDTGRALRERVADTIRDTIDYWQDWNSTSAYRGRWREAVERSALALKLLSHAESGGLLAAGTTSVPERIGGDRNWDYRYVWIRDAAFTVYALLELGHVAEADAFARWLVARLDGCADHDPPLAPLYDLDGSREIDETTIDHWSGFADSAPVRIGNAASSQRQLDVYGELIDALYLTDRHDGGLPLATWEHICRLVDHVIDHWRDPDEGIWEIRSDSVRHTSSLLMCWVAIERAMRMAQHRGRPADLERWRATRDEIHRELTSRGWNDDLGAFTRTLDGDDLDASLLLAPLVKFVPGDDPSWRSTLDAIRERLAHGPLVDRYDPDEVDDGVGGSEGSFLICSFWMVEALARAGEVDEAHRMFDRLLTYASPVGLYSEEIGPTGRQLGNFPQAFSHLALISAAIHLDEVLDARS